MPGQTTHGLPYPVGTDLIADGDNAIQALAEALDTLAYSGPLFRGALTGSPTITAGVQIAFTISENIGGGSSSAGAYTIPKAGLYRVTVIIKTTNTTGQAVQIRKNGAAAFTGGNSASAAFGQLYVDCLLRLVVNDVVGVVTTGSNFTVQTDAPESSLFTVQWVRG